MADAKFVQVRLGLSQIQVTGPAKAADGLRGFPLGLILPDLLQNLRRKRRLQQVGAAHLPAEGFPLGLLPLQPFPEPVHLKVGQHGDEQRHCSDAFHQDTSFFYRFLSRYRQRTLTPAGCSALPFAGF